MFDPQKYPVIQGGMGVGVSGPCLAKAVSLSGGIGTVSLTAAPHLLADALKKGDLKGDYRRALKHFPFPEIAQRVLDDYFVQYGTSIESKTVPMFNLNPSRKIMELALCAAFALVWLAKEGHENPVFANLLEKIQLPHIVCIFGAMLAGLDGLVVGAGLPRHIPEVIDAILEGREVTYPIDIVNSKDKAVMKLNLQDFLVGMDIPKMKRPMFLAIVSSSGLAKYLARSKKVDGFIVELATAGGHNAPPRGKEWRFDKEENLLYDPIEDRVNFEELKSLGLPFWIGGSFALPKKLNEARKLGACGVQVGTHFALCNESGIKSGYKREMILDILNGNLKIWTSSTVSPTGFPFKVALRDGSLSDPEVYDGRPRVCGMGYLRELCTVDGKLVYRCPAEPVDDYIRKGGRCEDTVGRACLCSGLSAAVGVGSDCEPPIFTLGDIAKDANILRQIIKPGRISYSASDVMESLLKPC